MRFCLRVLHLRVEIVSLLCLLLSYSCEAQEGGAVLTKLKALEILKKNGYRWQQTETLTAESEAQIREAESVFSPHVGFYAREYAGKVNPVQYGLTSLSNFDFFVAGSVGLNFGFELIDFASSARVAAAKENQGASRANQEHYRNELITLMLNQYLNVQKLKKNLDVIETTINRDSQIVALATKKMQSGAGVAMETNRAKGLLARDKLKKLELRESLMKSCFELGHTLGKAHLECVLPPLVWSPLPDEFMKVRTTASLEHRADLKAARATASAASQMKLYSERQSLPKLLIYGEIGSFGLQPMGIGGPLSGLIGAEISFPIFDGGLNSAKAQVDGVKAIQADLQAKQIELEAKSQVEMSIAQLNDGREAVNMSEQQAKFAQEELRFAKKKYQLGVGTGLEVSNAQVNLATSNDLDVQAIYAYEVAKILFFRATGNLNQYFKLENGGH